RLRQEVLEQLGWRIHRIWAPDWVGRRPEEVERLQQALAEADRTREAAPAAPAKAPPAEPVVAAVRKVEVAAPASGAEVPGTVPYRVCPLKVAKGFVKAELHAPRSRPELCRLLAQLVATEGPVHLDVAVRRLRQAWRADRAGDRIRRAVEEAAALCEG